MRNINGCISSPGPNCQESAPNWSGMASTCEVTEDKQVWVRDGKKEKGMWDNNNSMQVQQLDYK